MDRSLKLLPLCTEGQKQIAEKLMNDKKFIKVLKILKKEMKKQIKYSRKNIK